MFIKWFSNSTNIDLFAVDSISKFTLTGSSIAAYDTFVTTKTISIGVFTSKAEALKVFNEIVRRINLFGNTDDILETDIVFDVSEWLENNNDPWK